MGEPRGWVWLCGIKLFEGMIYRLFNVRKRGERGREKGRERERWGGIKLVEGLMIDILFNMRKRLEREGGRKGGGGGRGRRRCS